jgi:hypothetical protein
MSRNQPRFFKESEDMSNETIQNRTAAVRKTWTYGERLQRVVAADRRRQQLLALLGLGDFGRQLALAHTPVGGRRRA